VRQLDKLNQEEYSNEIEKLAEKYNTYKIIILREVNRVRNLLKYDEGKRDAIYQFQM